MNGRKRTVQIKFRVTEEERAFIEQKMQLVPTRNMEAYLRKMAIDGYIIQIDHADIKAMTAEIELLVFPADSKNFLYWRTAKCSGSFSSKRSNMRSTGD